MLSLVASLVVLLMQKQRDIYILYSLGLELNHIKRIFLMVGMMVTTTGLMLGSFFGLLFCFLQDKMELIKLGASSTFFIDYYPIKINLSDIFLIQIIVLILGALTSYFITKQNQLYQN